MKEKFIFLLFAVLFFLNTQFNLFHLIPQERFEYSKIEVSETLVIGKLLNSEQGSIMEDGGFTGTYYIDSNHSGRVSAGKYSYEKYLKNEVPPKLSYETYKSQIGGQAILYSLFDRIFNLDNSINILIFRLFNSLSISILLTLFLVWAKRKFGLLTAVLCFALLLPNYWIFVYGKSTWWCNWVYFLPFVYGLFFFERSKKISFTKYVAVFSLMFLVKFWFTGFEFITVFLISSSIPYLYYTFENQFRYYILFIVRHFLALVIPLLLTLAFQLYQFSLLTENFKDGINHLTHAYSRRSGGEYSYENSSNYLSTLKEFHLDIITRYLGNSFISEGLFGFKFPFAILIFVGILCSLFLYKKNIERKLIYVTWFSITAPFSWFILFKEHAHIHTHIDFIIWYCPFLLLLILLISLTLNFFHKNKKCKI